MFRDVSLFLVALVGLLLCVACQPTVVPTPGVTPAATPTSIPPAEPSPTPAATPTSVSPAEPSPGPTTRPTLALPTETPPAPTATPTTQVSPLSTPTPTPTTETSPLSTPAAQSGNADVVHVRAVEAADGTWTFHVTVEHPDTGWEDYADGWDVVIPDGTVVKPDPESPFTRLLLHPHEDEQPFTRSQSGITIPPDVTRVRVRAHDLVDGYGGREVFVDLTVPSGPDFEVERR